MNSSSDLEDPSGPSDHGKGEGRTSSSETTSSTDSVVMTQNMCDSLCDGADLWTNVVCGGVVFVYSASVACQGARHLTLLSTTQLGDALPRPSGGNWCGLELGKSDVG